MKICVLDPGLRDQAGNASLNLGDLIIQEAVNRELLHLFPQAGVLRLSTHAPLHPDHFAEIAQCALVIVGGTNLLSARMPLRKRSGQWAINAWDALRLRRAVLLAVGWQQYQAAPTMRTRIQLMLALSGRAAHSVRDSYTLRQLQLAGVSNAINTGCVTMWPFLDFDQRIIPTAKARQALVMITDYAPSPEVDSALLELLCGRYERVFAWPQGSDDEQYLRDLGFTGTLLPRSLAALDALLRDQPDLDYIGTRLHGGIRCLLSRHRSLILEIDNRAAEIARDTGLPTARRDDLARIAAWIGGSETPQITLDRTAIEEWRRQLRRAIPGHLETAGHKIA